MTDLSSPESHEALIVRAAVEILRDYARVASVWNDDAGAGELVASLARNAASECTQVLEYATKYPLTAPTPQSLRA